MQAPHELKEFLWFGYKNARACLFAGLFFLIQAWMVWAKLESWGSPVLGLHVRGRGELHHPVVAALRPADPASPVVLDGGTGIGFFIWLAENISTFFGIWRYPDQLGAWTTVHVGKWSSWSLLVVMTFTIVANLKHIKERVHVPA